jgi:hypothetical protein
MRISRHLPVSAAALAATGALLIAGTIGSADAPPATSPAPRQARDAHPVSALPHGPGAPHSAAPYCTAPGTSLLSVEWHPRTAFPCRPVPLPHAPCTTLPPGIARYVYEVATDRRGQQ